MSVHPCEARKYLGHGADGDPLPCTDPIAYRVTYVADDGEGGEKRAAIAYYCPTHMVEVVGIANSAGDFLADHGVRGLDIKRYHPRTPERSASTPDASPSLSTLARVADALEWLR